MMAKKRILVVTFSFPTKANTAAGIFILNQLECLKKRYDIKVLAPYPYVPKLRFLKSYKFSEVPFKEKISGIEVYRPKYFMFPRNIFTNKIINIVLVVEAFFSYTSSKKVIDKLAKEWRFDIIHSHGFVPDSVMASKIGERYSKPLIVTLHGEDVTKYSKKALLRGLSRKVLKECDRVICVSRSLRDEIYRSKLSDKDIEIIPSGYNARRFKPLGMEKCRKKLSLPKDKKIILFVGHLVERKGLVYLVKALKILKGKNSNFLCCIVGKGVLERGLKKMADSMGIKNNILFAGQKDPDEIPLWMNASDLLVLPSLNEGLANVLSEAMACAKPVVATKVAGAPEIVTEDTGFLVMPKDENGLAAKISLAMGRKWNKERLLSRAKEFSAAESAAKMAKIYDSFGTEGAKAK